MKDINQLIPDIYSLVQSKEGFNDHIREDLSKDIARRLRNQFSEYTERPTLRLSQMGRRCPCALWYSIKHPEMGEPVHPWTHIKFSFGHVLEALVIALAKAAGHQVEGEQDELTFDGIVGHRDCVVDGYTVDVKSASTRSFKELKEGSFLDLFGYYDQLDSYILAAKHDPRVIHKDAGYLLVVDKQNGHLLLHRHEVPHDREAELRARVAEYKSTVSKPNPPACECGTRRHGASGNIQLDVKASYSPYKYCCNPSLRTFLYSSGPVYLTKVRTTPKVIEVDRHGKVVYH